MLAAHPQLRRRAEMRDADGDRAHRPQGDLVAVGHDGLTPGLNLARARLVRAIGAEPVIITSVGFSMFGATDPDLTWLDMESVVGAHDLCPIPLAGGFARGGGDVGRGLSPAGRQQHLTDAAARNGVRPSTRPMSSRP